MIETIQLRRDLAANWTSVNPVLAQCEAGVETDTGKAKLGDGATAWNSLSYWNPSGLSGGGGGGAVASVFGRTGAVTAQSGDYTAAQVGADATGAASTAQGAAETYAAGLVTAETSRAEAAETANASAISTETSRAEAAEALLAPKASPALTGTPTAPTASALTGSTQLATTAYADSAVSTEKSRAQTAEALLAPLASPALTGSPTAPTQTTGDSSTKIATDAFVATAVAAETSRAETAEAAKLPLAGGTLAGSLAVGGALSTTPVTLTDAATIAVNAALSNYFRVTLGGNRTLGSPSNPADGQTVTFEVIQPGSGGPWTLSYSGAYSFTASTPQPSLSTTAGDHDFISFTYSASETAWVCTGYVIQQFGVLVTIAQGGTGQTTQQAALNALAGAQTSGQYLRGSGTNVAMSAIQAGDVPVLNQNTTGSAASANALNSATTAVNVSSAAAPSSGQVLTATGSAAATWQNASSGFSNPMTTLGDLIYENAAPAAARLAGQTTAVKNFLTQTGTGSVSAAPAWGAIAAADLPAATTSVQGAVIIDGTASDIQPLGTQAAGSAGKPADAGHVHAAPGAWLPADNSLLAATSSLDGGLTGTAQLIAGTVYLAKVLIRQAATVGHVSAYLSSGGTGSSTGSYVGLYNSSGTLLTGSSDIGGTLTSTGATVTWALTSSQSLTAGTFVWVTILVNLASTQPQLRALNVPSAFLSLNLSASAARYAVNGTGQTSLPSTITPASNSQAGVLIPWFGLAT